MSSTGKTRPIANSTLQNLKEFAKAMEETKDTNISAPTTTIPYPQPNQFPPTGICPGCGRCPYCGRPAPYAQPYPYWGPIWVGSPMTVTNC